MNKINTTIPKYKCDTCNWEGNDPQVRVYAEDGTLEHCPQCGDVAILNWDNPNVQLQFLKIYSETAIENKLQ